MNIEEEIHKNLLLTLRELKKEYYIDPEASSFDFYYSGSEDLPKTEQKRMISKLKKIGVIEIVKYIYPSRSVFTDWQRLVSGEDDRPPKGLELRLVEPKFTEMLSDYEKHIGGGNKKYEDLKKYLSRDVIYISKKKGILCFDDNKKLTYKVTSTKRMDLIYSLKDNILTASKIIELFGYSDTRAVNKDIKDINDRFEDKLKKTEKLIINEMKKGYELNLDVFLIKFEKD